MRADGSASPCPVCGGGSLVGLYEAGDPRFNLPGRFRVSWCPECRNASTLPRPSEEELLAHYPGAYDPYQPELAERTPSALHRALLAVESRFAAGATDAFPVGTLLDVGCGNGTYLAAMAARGFQVTGLEMDPRACALVARRGLRVLQGDFLSVEIAPASYDVVTMNHFLEHSRDPRSSLLKARRILRPHGRLAVGVPNFASWPRRWFGAAWSDLDLPRHLTHFTQEGLARLLSETGFEELRVRFDPGADANSILSSLLVRSGKRHDPLLRRAYPALHAALYPVGLPLSLLRRSAWMRVFARASDARINP